MGITPDMAVFSKALGNGYPISAIIGKSEVMEAAQKTFISSTNWTESVGPAAALAMIKKHRKVDAGKHLVAIGEKVQQGLSALAKNRGLGLGMSGIPPLTHFSFQMENGHEIKAFFVQLMMAQGFLASNLFYSMYAHSMENVEDYLHAADLAFDEIVGALGKGKVKEKLIGQPAVAGFKRLA